MALRKIRLSSTDPEADLNLWEAEIAEEQDELEHAGRVFRFHHVELIPASGASEEGRWVFAEGNPLA
jgi:hypothetical protein